MSVRLRFKPLGGGEYDVYRGADLVALITMRQDVYRVIWHFSNGTQTGDPNRYATFARAKDAIVARFS